MSKGPRPSASSVAKRPVVSLAARTAEQTEKLDDAHRRLLADWCRIVDARLNGRPAHATPQPSLPPDPLAGVKLSPRAREILACLLNGDSEKQIALKLSISPHTVHTYVKKLHKTLGVNSRGELLARFVSQ